MNRQFVTVLVLASALLPGCENTPSAELPDFCLSPSDCQDLSPGECRMADCVDGQCVIADDPSANGSACGMSDPCVAVAGECDDGVCAGSSPVVCPEVDCMIGQCEGSVGKCVYMPGPEGAACDIDGNPCTYDSCVDGTCAPGENRCPCKASDDCPAMEDRCLGRYQCATSGCVIEPLSAVTCPDPGLCEEFSCNPASGKCEPFAKSDGTICVRADSCTTGGICTGGVCGVTSRCRDDNPCTDDLCDADTGACSFVANQSPCDDSDACTGEGVCSGGTCVTVPVSCDDGNDCTVDGCDGDSGCTKTPVLSGTPCFSVDPCVVATVCDEGGVCGGGSPACDDGNDCTLDTCDPGSGVCGHLNVAGTCDDRNPCTVGERCLSGVCGGGAAVPGCCNFDADCDDGDACTPTRCSGQRCVSTGQDPDSCPVSVEGCRIDWCDARTGQCAGIDSGIPVVMAAWEFGDRPVVQGFVWSEPAGVVTGSGLTAAAGATRAAFLLPRRLVPPGVVIAYIAVASGGCGSIQFSRTPDRAGCIVDGGLEWVVADFSTAGATDVDSRLDIEVSVSAGAVVPGVYVYLWHPASCGSDSIVVGDVSVSDLSMSVGMGETAIVANTGSAIAATLVSRDGRVVHRPLQQDPFAVMAGRFSTSVARSGGRYLAAWGGADDEVRFATLDSSGWGAISTVPDIAADGQIEAWPALTGVGGGGWTLAFAYGDGSDFDIAVARLDQAGDISMPIAGTSVSLVGSRTKPKLIDTDNGIIGWITSIWVPSTQYFVELVQVDSSMMPTGLDVSLGVQAQPMPDWVFVRSGSNYFCLWQQVDGVVGGAVVDVETLAVLDTFTFGDATAPNSRPLIMPYGDGALAVSIQGTGATASIVYRTVSADGAVADPVTIVSPVVAGLTHIAAGRFGPGMFLLAYNDHLGTPEGLRLKVFSPACPSGFIDSGVVCTGLADGLRSGVPE